MIEPAASGPVLGKRKHWTVEQLHEVLANAAFRKADFR